jgi:hypothetical protein
MLKQCVSEAIHRCLITHFNVYSINYENLNPDQDTMDEKSSPPDPMPAFKRSMSNVGRAPGRLARVLSHTRSISSTAGEPLRPAVERGETLHWDEPSNIPPV